MEAAGDVLVIGRAKTGTTVLARSIAAAFDPPARYLSEPRSPEAAAEGRGAGRRVVKVIHEHWGGDDLAGLVADDAFAARLAIVRDPRDEYLSRVLFQARREIWSGRAGRREMARWADVWRRKERDPSISFAEIGARYAAIFDADDPAKGYRWFAKGVRTYLDWLEGADVSSVCYEDFASGDFEAVSEAVGRPVSTAGDLGEQWYTKRSAASGEWRKVFALGDLGALMEATGEVVERAGYDDWTLDATPLDPAHYSGYVESLWRQFASRPGSWRVRLRRALSGRL